MGAAKTVALNDVAVIERDIVDPTSIESGTLFVGLENIESGGRFVGVRPVDAGELASSKFAFTPQHLLYGKLRPYLAKIARPDFEGICSTDILPVLPGPDLDRGYLGWLLLTPEMVARASSRATGANLPRLSPNALADLRIPLPPLPEQRRIAEILDKADALRAKRRAALAQLDTLTQSIFLDMFGDPATNPKGWDEGTRLGDVADIASGVTKGRNLNGQRTRAVLYLAVVNVQDRALDLSTVKSIEATEAEIDRYRLLKDDLLLTEGGDPDKLGRGTLWSEELPECIHQNHIFRVRLTTARVHPLFLNWLVSSSRGKKYFLRSAKQTTGIASINMTQLRGFPMLIPPVELQRDFATAVAGVNQLKNGISAASRELDSLFASLLHRAFRGEL
ncbi:MAG: restriction endonuclease subunit S [Burkholderiales bacterium]|nr:restriction endonuclease subunit S [Burkholderiales bacterium]